MTDEITLYYNPRSRAAMARWMLEEIGAPYRLELIDFEKGENRTPQFLAMNPMGKLPTIVHRGVVVTETPAIIAYLADIFPEAGLAPALDDPRRGTWYRWLFFGGSCVEPAILDKMFDRPPPAQKGALGWGDYETVLAALKQALTPGPYLLGDQFSAADVYIGGELGWAAMFGAPGLKDEPVFADYIARVQARDAFKRVWEG